MNDTGSMPLPDVSTWRRIHLVGIGGAGMSGIAKLLLARRIDVSGCDLKESSGLEALRAAGASIAVGHHPSHVADADAVVVSSAIPSDSAEVVAARDQRVPVLLRAQVLGALMRGGRGIAVAGTHGKTTTTSMVAVMLRGLGLDPTFVIGGDLNEAGSGAYPGDGDLFVAEADESDGSFLLLRPDVAVVTNVEEDHLDFYRDAAQIEHAFRRFASAASTVVACGDDAGARRALDGLDRRIIWYGQGVDADVRVEPRTDLSSATVVAGGVEVEVRLRVAGRHNLLNAAAALGVALALDAPLGDAADALGGFTGVRRRYELRGEAGGASFVDDYAHHPTEIAATLDVARSQRRRVVAVFQPHRYTRTASMSRALGESLRDADVVVVTDVYGAGEAPIPGVTGKLVVDALTEGAPGKRVVYLPRRAEVAPFLAAEVRSGDLVLTLGAGDITMVGQETLERLREAS